MKNAFIPYGRQHLDEEDIKAVCEALKSPWLTTGPMVEKFEKALAEKVGALYAVVFNSGTAALHAAYHAAGVRSGDEIITSPITFAATANAALYLGAKPVFVDIGEDSFHIDVNKIEPAITSRTKVIAPVDMTGIPADLDRVMDIAGQNNLIVVEDACHALGATYKGRPVGSIAHMTVFSFHPVKHITTGEGGAVTTNNEDYCNRLKIFRNHGIERDSAAFSEAVNLKENDGPWYYEQEELGFNYRLPDINCALGLSQLNRLDYFLERRREIAKKYYDAFADNPFFSAPPLPGGEASLYESAWHLYILLIKNSNLQRNNLVKHLYEKGIGTQVHYIPVYLHPYYQNLGYKKGLCPLAEDYYKRCLTIPLYPAMNDNDVKRVIDAFSDIKEDGF